ncbi:MAG: hypothetical protein IKG21_09045 [Atopobiaceae bacterium]|nr:hypothetical protein [Atopobiaceae bacterium]
MTQRIGAATTYELRLYDRPLLRFTWFVDEFGEQDVRTIALDADGLALLPPSLTINQSGEAVASWLKTRRIPKNRAFVDKVLAERGLSVADTKGIMDVCRGLSTTDAFWVVPEGFEGSWTGYNLFSNELDPVLALVAYTGHTTSQMHAAGLSTEWTTSGSYPKAWRRMGETLVLYKAGSPVFEGVANTDMGPWSEFFAAQVADALGIAHVPYGLDRWHGRMASTCELMNDDETALVTHWDAFGRHGYADVVATYASLGTEWLSFCVDMMVFDALICNTDRHVGNFGVLRRNCDGVWLRPAPLFDHNLALFPHDMPSDYATWPERATMLTPSDASISFDAVMGQLVTKKHHQWARRLLDFKLKDHAVYPIGEERLDALNRLLHAQARRLLVKEPQELGNIARHFAREQDDASAPLLTQPRLSLDAGTFARIAL